MLNNEDIQKRLKDYPEPDEVKKIRENIINSFKNLEFQEGPHKYYVHYDDGETEELPSVSGTVEKFEPYTDWQAIKERYALNHGLTVEQVTRMWKETNIIGTNNGSSTHLYGEMLMHFFQGHPEKICDVIKPQYEEGFLIPYSGKQVAAMNYYMEMYDSFYDDSKPIKMYPVMPESQIYIKRGNEFGIKQRYAGTFDILHAYQDKGGKWKLAIHDWKGLPLETPILTTKGFKTMGTLEYGDSVYDKDGNPAKITGISEIHNNPCMKITFDDNYSIVADEEHRWLVYFNKQNGEKDEKVMTTLELHEYLKNHTGKKRHTLTIPKIQINKPLNTEKDNNIEVDPYVFGVWLGDGHSACGYVTNMYDEIFNEIEKRGYHVGNNVNDGKHCGQAKTRCVFGLATQLKKYNLLKNKHIPDEFINGFTFEERFEILQGLMDTDGYYNKTRKRFVMATTKKSQVDFTVKLVTSLGIKPTVIKATGKCNNCKKKPVFEKWDIAFSTDMNPFLIRKIKVECPTRNERDYRNISSVEYCETVKTRCIEVDSPSHTYLADTMLLVTHNTNKSLSDDYKRSKGVYMEPPFDDLIDESLSHYALQLSLYQIGLMQLGYEIGDRRLIWLKDDGTYEKIALPDMTGRLIDALRE